MRSGITTAPIDSASLLREVSAPHNGATVLFEGIVREQNEGRTVTGIEYAAYKSMAERELTRIVQECSKQFGTADLIAVHRIGRLDVGEASVVIAVAHPHRVQAYEASRYIIEQIKLRLPIWKREEYADGTREWVGQGRESGIGNRESYSPYRDAYADRALGGDSRFPISDSRFPISDSRFPISDSR